MSRGAKKNAVAMPPGAPETENSSTPGTADRPSRWSERWLVVGVCLFLAVITFVVFGQTLRHEFVNYDDGRYVADNPAVLGGLSLKGIVWAFTHDVNVNWTPLTVLSHMLDCQLYGTHAGGHHLTNALLHLASAIVLFLVMRRMTGALWRSAFVAALFAIHPLHVESVAWIAERRDVLSGLFFMLTLGAYARYAQRRSRVEGRESKAPAAALNLRLWTLDYYLVLLLFALALLSKPMVVTLPLVLLLLDYWPLKRFPQGDGHGIPWRLMVEKIPLLMLSGVICVATLFTQQEVIQPVPVTLRLGNALVSYLAYMRQMIWPAGLAVFYPYPSHLTIWTVGLSLLILTLISAGVMAGWRKYPYLAAGWCWYLIMLVPVIGLIQSGLRARADRYTYLPEIGLYILMTWLVVEVCSGWRNRRLILGCGAVIILGALTWCARVQTAWWQNSESLWTHTLACTSDNAEAHYNLGNALLKKDEVNEAIVHYQTALQIAPRSADVHNNLGNALIKKGDVNEAIAQYQKALEINSHYAKAHVNLGGALLKKGDMNEAIAQYQAALQINPDDAKAHIDLGNVLIKRSSLPEAMVHYQQALRINPRSMEALNNLAWILATTSSSSLRNGLRAVELARRANQLADGENPIILRTLAAAYAEAGKFGDARQSAQKALSLAQAAGQTNLVEQLNGELKLYTAKLPFREGNK